MLARLKTQVSWSLPKKKKKKAKNNKNNFMLSLGPKEKLGPLFGVTGKMLMDDTWKKKKILLGLQEELIF